MSNYEKAQAGLAMIKDAIISELQHHPQGLTNAEVVNRLGLESDFEGGQRNYLSWSILGILLGDGKVTMKGERRKRTYHVAS